MGGSTFRPPMQNSAMPRRKTVPKPELDPWAVPATLRTACSPAVPPTPTRTRSLGPAWTTYPLYRHLGRGLRRTSAISRCYPILPKYFGAPRRPPRPSATAYLRHFTLLPHFAKIFWGSSPTTSAVGYGVPRPFHAATPFCQIILGLLADHLARRLRRTSARSR